MAFEKNPISVSGTLVYVCVPDAVEGYRDSKTGADPSKEWKASVVLTDEDYVDELEETASKVWKTQVSLKKVKSVDFEEAYKCDLPEGAGKNVWVFTLRKNTMLGKTGKEVPEQYRPRVFQSIGNKIVEITNDPEKRVGNGSVGAISIDYFTRTDGSVSLYLKNVRVDKLIAYEKYSSDYVPGSEFEAENESQAQETKKESKPAVKKTAKAKDEIPDEELPF